MELYPYEYNNFYFIPGHEMLSHPDIFILKIENIQINKGNLDFIYLNGVKRKFKPELCIFFMWYLD